MIVWHINFVGIICPTVRMCPQNDRGPGLSHFCIKGSGEYFARHAIIVAYVRTRWATVQYPAKRSRKVRVLQEPTRVICIPKTVALPCHKTFFFAAHIATAACKMRHKIDTGPYLCLVLVPSLQCEASLVYDVPVVYNA